MNHDSLFIFLSALNIPLPESEYAFHPTRKWRFDYAWVDEKVAMEVEGGAWIKGRHNRGRGFINDMEKYNSATILGWRVLRVTPEQVANGYAAKLVKPLLEGK
jgi:very-short-patch-repair endonuclease